jgi:NAD(P)-dependent dehydrogenase (short-subunit alcohol dehydrogenase family)
MTKLSGKTALVTGGSKGIGYAVAESMIKAGMNVTITARTAADVKKATDKLNKLGMGKALGIRCDVRKLKEQEKAVEKTLTTFGGLDVLVANAGVGHFAPIDKLKVEQWQEVIDTNLTGVFYSVKSSVEALKKTKGFIITISSLAGTNFFENASAYNASKFGLTGMTQAMMLDLRKYGIKVSTIMPGSVATPFNNHKVSAADAWKIQPEDIAEMVMYLLNTSPRNLPSKIEVRPSQPPSK